MTARQLAREVRRPKHSGSIARRRAESGRFSYGASLAYIGERIDTDFDSSRSTWSALDPYWLAGARVAYRVTSRVELFGRVANAFDADYQDVVGYRTEGRSAFAGVRIAAWPLAPR